MKAKEVRKRLAALAMAVATAASLTPQTALTAYAADSGTEVVSVQEIEETTIGTGTESAVTITSPTNGTVTLAKADGSAISSGDDVEDETVVTVTATPNEHYALAKLEVKDADGNSVALSSNNTFSMPATTVTVTATFGLDIADATKVSIEATNPKYDGTSKTPTIIVKNVADPSDPQTLVEDTAYTVTVEAQTNATASDTYTATIKGKGDYAGTKTVNWGIDKADATIANKSTGGYTLTNNYTGEALTAPAKTNFDITADDDAEVSFQWYKGDHTSDLAAAPSTDKLTSAPTNAGTYTLAVTTAAGDNYKETSKGFKVVINQVASSVKTAPAAVADLTYTGETQALITAGVPEGGEIQYKLTTTPSGETNGYSGYGTEIPKGTAAGNYVVTYKVVGDDNHSDAAEGTVNVSIAKADATIETAPAAVADLAYTGVAQDLITAGVTEDGTLKYSFETNDNWGTSLPQKINAGTYRVYYKVFGDDNHKDSKVQYVNVTIAKAVVTADDLEFTSDNYSKSYDGTTDATASIQLKANTYGTHAAAAVSGGTAAYNSANVADANAITYTTAKVDTDPNYTIPAGLAVTITNGNGKTVVITKATPNLTNVQATAITYGQALSASTITGKASIGSGNSEIVIDGTWAFDTPATKPTVAQSGSKDITFTPDDADNYNTASGNANVTVDQKELSVTLKGAVVKEYSGDKTVPATGHTLDVSIDDGSLVTGDTVTLDKAEFIYTYATADVGTGLKVVATVNVAGGKDGFVDSTATAAANYKLPDDISANIGYITKATGATNPDTLTVNANCEDTYYFDLSTLLSGVDAGEVSEYHVTVKTDADGIVADDLVVTGATLAIPVAEVEASKSAVLTVTFDSDNYDIADTTLTVSTADMEYVEVDGLTVTDSKGETEIGVDTEDSARVLTFNENPVESNDDKLSVTSDEKGDITSDVSIDEKWYAADEDGNLELLTTAPTNVGDYVYVATLNNGTYYGKAEIWFTIVPKDIADAVIALVGGSTSLTYTGAEQTQTISSVTLTGYTSLGVDTDYVIVDGTDKGIDADTYTLAIEGIGNFEGNAEVEFTIAPKNLSAATITQDSAVTLTYNGEVQKPQIESVTITGIADPLEAGTDYTLLQSETAVDAGTYSFVLAGKGNFTGTSTEQKFTIAKADPYVTTAAIDVTGDAGLKLADVSITGQTVTISEDNSTAVEGSWSWSNSAESLAIGENTCKAQFTPSDADNFNTPEEAEITVNLAQKLPAVKAIVAPQAINVDNGTSKDDIKGKLPAKVALTMEDGVAGSYEAAVVWSDFEYDAAKTDAQTLTISGTVTQSGELAWGSVGAEATITVNVAAKPAVQEPPVENDNVKSVDTIKGTAEVKDVVTGEYVEVALAIVVEGAVYRMYNPNTGEHFYTKSEAERDYLKNAGWNYEANASFAAIAADDEGAEPVYRVYNPNTGMHHYTMSYGEASILKSIGWDYEGISFYAYSKDSGKGSPQYRLYNPNEAGNGEHHWTVDSNEKDALVQAGWEYEGIAWNVK